MLAHESSPRRGLPTPLRNRAREIPLSIRIENVPMEPFRLAHPELDNLLS